MEGFLRFVICLILFSIISGAAAVDTIVPDKSMKNGETLVSSKGSFELGFFRSSNGQYLGIWYNKPGTRTVVWVANRENPLSDGEGLLVLDSKGILALLNSTKGVIWSSNTSRSAETPVAQLLDSGNLVVQEEKNYNEDDYLWQSFDYPSDTLLPGMKLGKNLKTGFDWFLSSWRSTDDPAPGIYSIRMETQGVPQLVVEKGPKIQYRAGPWNGISFAGRRAEPNSIISSQYVSTNEEAYYRYEPVDSSVETMFVLNSSGLFQFFLTRGIHDWELLMVPAFDVCQTYAFCGKFANCNFYRSPVCSCLEGYLPKSPEDWNSGNWSGGCVRETPSDCETDMFLKHTGLKWPDTSNSKVNMTMNLKECEQMCLTNCSCTAYTDADVRFGGSGCLMWFGDLIDIRDLTPGGQDLYTRLARSDMGNELKVGGGGRRTTFTILAMALTTKHLKFYSPPTLLQVLSQPFLLTSKSLTIASDHDRIYDKSMKNGETLVSSKGSFELGFFRSSKGQYLGIWYNKPGTQTVVWVANRENPLSDGEGLLVLDSKGILALLNSTKGVIWSSNTSRSAETPVAQLLDSGNLVVQEEKNYNEDDYLWQSFDYPSDTLLPGMKLGKNLKTGFDWFLSSWRSTDDPAPGRRAEPNSIISSQYVSTNEEAYYRYEPVDSSVETMFVLNSSGLFQFFLTRGIHDWELLMVPAFDVCQTYAFCGKFANCNFYRSPVCSCLEGYLPKSPEDWNSGNWSGGCVRETPSDCETDMFLKHTGLKWPDTSNSTVNMTMNLKECEQMCLTNCSCTAYTDADVRFGGSGCLMCLCFFDEKIMEGLLRDLICLISFSIISGAAAVDTIVPSKSMKNGETLVSSKGRFELGFFRRSKGQYLGIWYTKPETQTVVWVANRENPLSAGEGVLVLNSKGTLALLNRTKGVIWSSNTSRSADRPVARLLESGNLVVQDEKKYNLENYLWQSFDYPSDTLLPGMKVGKNLKTGFDRYLSSWKSTDDPAPGLYSVRIITQGVPQLVIEKGPKIQYSQGPWNGIAFEGRTSKLNPLTSPQYVLNDVEVYFMYELKDSSIETRLVLNSSGLVKSFLWRNGDHDWKLGMMPSPDICDQYAFCGKFAKCNINSSPVCSCLEGYFPKSPVDWNSGNWSGGCVRDAPSDCGKDVFIKHTALKWPDASNSTVNMTVNLKDCEEMCLTNCSCTAYTDADVRFGGSGCLMWFGDLIDIRDLPSVGQDLYIRLAPSDKDVHQLNFQSFSSSYGDKEIEGVEESNIHSELCHDWHINPNIGLCFLFKEGNTQKRRKDYMNDGEEELMLLPVFDFETIASATNNFSSNNKLGQGGFGPVYKGTLLEKEQDIAVKRLSRSSGQGLQEFKNEVILIAKLQHRNLVKLLGCCIEGDEKMLIYEYLPNKSLDYFIFEVLRCIHVGLLCVQQRPEDRPDMLSVVLMLRGDSALPEPKQPGFFTGRNPFMVDSSGSKTGSGSINEDSITQLYGR
ncbi:hypothetical protein SLEP1_g26563 [Rubroshorea leprosula]|uniref:Uncharacterized protein n=1 Tax=Rubroshorea leprosula TaxID=152421 RepID=A0AAV5JMN0_9ROSI|nr:hypothetical protein SLEP1_g26563 [Rubroshorea leprosula]